MRLFLIAVLLFWSVSAQAVLVRWDLAGKLFQGGTVSGSFVYDADTGAFTDIHLITSSESPSGGLSFTNVAVIPLYGMLNFTGNNFTHDGAEIGLALDQIFLPLLTNDGGVLVVNPDTTTHGIAEFLCSGLNCTSGGLHLSNWDTNAHNTLTGTVIPLPATVWLFLSALFGLSQTRSKFFHRSKAK